MLTIHRMKIYEIINNMNYYNALFIQIFYLIYVIKNYMK